MKLTYPSVFNFIICFAVALVWGNNYYWMKVANCRSEKVARRSFVAAAIILIVVFMVPLCFIGGYMGAFYPEQLTLNGGTVAPTGTYGYVAKTFVSLFGSLVVISAVAASISTASTSALGASAVANRDIYQRLINPKADAKKSLKMSKIIMLLIGRGHLRALPVPRRPHLPVRLCQLLAGAPRHFAGPGRHLAPV